MQNGRSVLVDRAGKMGVLVSDLDPVLMSWILVGAEGEGEEGGSSGSGEGSQGGSQGRNGGGDSTSGGNGEESGDPAGTGEGGEEGSGDQDTFDRAYVEGLRKENADYRIRAKKAEDELNEKKKAEMSELEKAQTEVEEERERASRAVAEVDRMRLQMAVTSAAASQNFYDPEDALSLIDRDSISKNDEGEYNKQSVQAAVKRLADSKPHLVKGKNAGAGSGDGGARGQGGGNMTDEERQKQLEKEYAERGGVPLPKL